MHVVLPELDGRVLAGALAFKDAAAKNDALGFTAYASRPEPDRIAAVARRIAALVRLQTTPREERRIAVVMPDYPGAGGRTGYAVGLDVPASVLALLADLEAAGYSLENDCEDCPALLKRLQRGADAPSLPLEDYERFLAELPDEIGAAITAAWGGPTAIPIAATARSGFAAVSSATSPWRCRRIADRPATGAPTITTRSCRRAMRLLAFGLWLQHGLKAPRPLASRRAWHPRMAARQSRSPVANLFSGSGRRRAAGDLSVHRRRIPARPRRPSAGSPR